MGNRFKVITHSDNEGNECWVIYDSGLCYNLDEIYYNLDWATVDANSMEDATYG